MGSARVGSVPLTKYSRRLANPSCAPYPETLSTEICETLSGTLKLTVGFPFKASWVTFLQIGEAPETPEATFNIEVLSLFPTHTPTIACSFPPIVQLSFLSLVVPVLTMTLARFKWEFSPNVSFLASLSDRILEMRNAWASVITCFPFLGVLFSKTLPLMSVTFKIATGSTLYPLFTNAE